jgi:hypothetical protein
LLLLPLRQETMVGNKSIGGGGGEQRRERPVLSPFVVVETGCVRESRQFNRSTTLNNRVIVAQD